MNILRAFARAPLAARCYFSTPNRSSKSIDAIMATPQCWDDVATSGFDDALFGFYCNAFAEQLVKRHSAGHADLCDIGAGTGAVCLGLAQKYPDARIEAADFSPSMIEQLKRKLGGKGLVGKVNASVQDAQSLPQAWSGKFDAVFSNCTIMFIPDRVKAFQEMYRCLKPGGIAVVTSWSTRRDNPAIGYCYAAIEDAMQAMFKRGDPSDPILAAKIKDHVPIPDRPHPNFVLSNPKLFKQELLYSGFPSVNVAKLWATFPYDHEEFVRRAVLSFAHTFPDKSEQFIKDFVASLRKQIAHKSAGDLRTCVNVAIASSD